MHACSYVWNLQSERLAIISLATKGDDDDRILNGRNALDMFQEHAGPEHAGPETYRSEGTDNLATAYFQLEKRLLLKVWHCPTIPEKLIYV